jgi:hypothetical protein
MGFFGEYGGEFGILGGEEGLALAFLVARASSMAAVSLAITGDPMGMKRDLQ